MGIFLNYMGQPDLLTGDYTMDVALELLAESRYNIIRASDRIIREYYTGYFDTEDPDCPKFEDLEEMDEDELHDKYCDFYEDVHIPTIRKRIEDYYGMTQAEYYKEKNRSEEDEYDDYYNPIRLGMIKDGKEFERHIYDTQRKSKKYMGDGSNLPYDKKVCTVHVPFDFYRGQDEHDPDKVYRSAKDFQRGTNFISITFSHISGSNENTLVTLVEGNKLPKFTVETGNKTINIETRARKAFIRKYSKEGLDVLVLYIAKYAEMFHHYLNKDTVAMMRLYVYNTTASSPDLSDNVYIDFSENYNKFIRSIL